MTLLNTSLSACTAGVRPTGCCPYPPPFLFASPPRRVTAIDSADLTSSASLHLMILSDGGAFAPTSRSPEPSSPRQQTRQQPASSIDHSAPASPLGRSKSPLPVSVNAGASMPPDQAPLPEASVVRQVRRYDLGVEAINYDSFMLWWDFTHA